MATQYFLLSLIIITVTKSSKIYEEKKISHTLLVVVDLLQILEMNPCASLDLSQGTQKPDTNSSHHVLHPATCAPHIHQR